MIGKGADDCGVLKLFMVQHFSITAKFPQRNIRQKGMLTCFANSHPHMNFASQNLKNTSQIAKCELLIRSLAKGQC